jgi:hypothetical protein
MRAHRRSVGHLWKAILVDDFFLQTRGGLLRSAARMSSERLHLSRAGGRPEQHSSVPQISTLWNRKLLYSSSA